MHAIHVFGGHKALDTMNFVDACAAHSIQTKRHFCIHLSPHKTMLLASCLCTGQTPPVSKAEHYKAQANEAFKAGDFEGAIAGYSGSIQADPTNPVFFSNRAMAYLKVQSTMC